MWRGKLAATPARLTHYPNPRRFGVATAKNNLSHPSHASHLSHRNMVGSIMCIIPAQGRSSMKSSTMTKLALERSAGHDDGGRPDAGVPQANRETGMANRKQGITRELAYLTSQHGRRAQEKPKKGQILGETKPLCYLE